MLSRIYLGNLCFSFLRVADRLSGCDPHPLRFSAIRQNAAQDLARANHRDGRLTAWTQAWIDALDAAASTRPG